MTNQLPSNIFLCGFMGAGKSTLGRALASTTRSAFRDLDSFIVSREGRTIPRIFDEEGEKGFRRIEQKALVDTIENFEGVVALGGGSLQNAELTQRVKNEGLLIFIDTPFSVIFQRITADKSRPLLLDENGNMKSIQQLKQELKSLYRKRRETYAQAELTINPAAYPSVEKAVHHLIKLVNKHDSQY